MKTTKKTARRAGSIVYRGKLRGEHTWTVRLFVSVDASGKRLYESKTVKGIKEAAQDALDDLRKGKRKGSFTGRDLTVGDMLDDVLRDYRINGQDIRWAELVIKRLRPTFGKLRAAKLQRSHIEQHIDTRLKAKAANATINHELSMLRRAFNLAVENEKLSVVPLRIRKLAEDNVRKGFFEHSEYTSLRQHLRDDLRPVLTFAYYTGCRVGEIINLRWSQVDLIRRIVRLEAGETKNKEARIIPIQVEELYQTLAMARAKRDEQHPDSPWVFSREGARLAPFNKAWAIGCKAAGLWDVENEKPTRLFHDLRRTGVRNLRRAGVSEKVAMRISGHKTRAVFERYNIDDERDVIEAMTRLNTYTQERVAAEQKASNEKAAALANPVTH